MKKKKIEMKEKKLEMKEKKLNKKIKKMEKRLHKKSKEFYLLEEELIKLEKLYDKELIKLEKLYEKKLIKSKIIKLINLIENLDDQNSKSVGENDQSDPNTIDTQVSTTENSREKLYWKGDKTRTLPLKKD